MSVPINESIPEQFEAGQLLPPTEEARRNYEAVFLDLGPISSTTHSRAVEVSFLEPVTRDTVGVYCSRVEIVKPNGQPSLESTLVVSAKRRGREFFLSSELSKPSEVSRAAIGELVQRLSCGIDERHCSWLREAYFESQLGSPFKQLSVEALLANSPFGLLEYTHKFVHLTFANGYFLEGDWLSANDKFIKRYPPDQDMRSLYLKTPDGMEYDYTSRKDGVEKLFVSSPGKGTGTLPEDCPPTKLDIRHEEDLGTSGTTEFLGQIVCAIAQTDAAERLGLNVVTQSSLTSFTNALRAGLNSGVAID